MAVNAAIFAGFATFCFLLSLVFTFFKRHELYYSFSFRGRGWTYWLICLFLLANEALTILQIARYSLSNQWVGLLPVQLVGILLVFLFQHVVHARFRVPLLIFYLTSMLFLGVQIYFIRNQPNMRSYSNSDQEIDVGCMIGVFGVLAILELVQHPAIEDH